MRNKKWISGQGLVEFAQILPILLLLVVGALDFGRAFYMKVVMENSAREGAYFMAYHATDDPANAIANAKEATQIEAENSGFTIPLENITIDCIDSLGGTDCDSESTVTVTVESEFQLVVSALFGGPFELVNDARMLIP